MYAIMLGSAVYGGFRFIGPFTGKEEAAHYAEHVMSKTIVATSEVVKLERCGDALDYQIKGDRDE